MNARNKEYNLKLDVRQIPDAIACIFHSLLLHRSTGKFQYKNDTNFSLGSIGIKEVECECIDLAYVRVNSDELERRLSEDVRDFHAEVERNTRGMREDECHTQIGMQFYQRRRKQWLFSQEEFVPWEQWTLNLAVLFSPSEDLGNLREQTAESLSEIVLSVCSSINRPQYIPKMPSKKEVADIFDTQYSDVQPFLFKIVRPRDSSSPGGGMAYTVRKLVKDTLFI